MKRKMIRLICFVLIFALFLTMPCSAGGVTLVSLIVGLVTAILFTEAGSDTAIEQYFINHGYLFSYELYHHAITDGSTYYAGITPLICYGRPVRTDVLEAVQNNAAIIDKIDTLLPQAKETGSAEGYYHDGVFDSGDLFFSIHAFNYQVSVFYKPAQRTYQVFVEIEDRYDFDCFSGYDASLAQIGVCYADIAGKIDHVKEFDIFLGVSFDIQEQESSVNPDTGHTGSPDAAAGGSASSGGSNSGSSSVISYVENQYYRNPNASYTEGYYTGEWNNGAPNGYGKIVYADVNGDGKRYSISTSTTTYYATSYEGCFSNGLRYGEGTVYYEGGYKDEGTFYGAWAADKLVFEGKRWYIADGYNGYWPWSIIAANTVSPKSETHGDWVSVMSSYSVTYHANGGSNAPGKQTKKQGQSLTLSSTQPTRSGYDFQGWAAGSGGSVTYQPGSSYDDDADLTLYAVWKKTVTDSFDDVQRGSWFYDAVSWAGVQNIAQGTANRTFNPNLGCTRAQAVTFLWRAAGSPNVVTSNPFKDVRSKDYYYHAVLWAKESGIVYGVSNDAFAPELMVSRAQFATMLYRFAGSTPVYGSIGFDDVPQRSYYTDAVRWCAFENVTNGTSEKTFSPDKVCTRAEIVTFLYRYCNS